MDLLPVANKLEYEGLGVQGKTIFVNFMPMECREGILLRSSLAGANIDHELPGYYKTEFGVTTRSHQYTNAKSLADEIMGVLCFTDTQLDDIFIKYVRPAKLPVAFPVSDGNFYEVMILFEIVYVGKTYVY